MGTTRDERRGGQPRAADGGSANPRAGSACDAGVTTFLVALGLFTVLVGILTIPLIVVTRRRERQETVRKFLFTGAAVAISCAMISATSERLVRQCEEAGNPTCVDFGASGIQFVLVAGYGIAVAIATLNIHRS